MNYQRFMEIALEEAKKGILRGEQPYGAVLVADGEIVATSHNEVMSSHDHLNHSEVVAIKKYLSSRTAIPKDLTLVTTCEPCVNCFGTAWKAGVNRFVYGTSLEDAILYGSNDIHMGLNDFQSIYQFEVISGVLKEECDQLIRNFYHQNNIVTYSSGTPEEIYWMKQALEIGKQGMIEKDELPFGSILVAGNEVLDTSPTMTYTLNSPITHSDFMVLFNAQRKVYSPSCQRPLVLYSSLEPHLLGFGAAIKCRVDKVVFGLEAIPDGGACYLPNIVGIKENIPTVVGGVLRNQQYELLKEFLNTHEKNRIGYDYAKKLVKIYEDSEKR